MAELLTTQAVRIPTQADRQAGDDGPEKAAARHEEYSVLVKQGLRECAAGNRAVGMQTFHKCIALRPEQPVAYANLGYCLRDGGDFDAALPPLLKAASLFEEGSEQWATTLAVAWFAFSADPVLCSEVPSLPAWLGEDVAPRLALAERCATAAPSSMQVQAMLGMALAEEGSTDSLANASQCFMRAAKLTDEPATKRGYLDFARALLVRVKEAKEAGGAPPVQLS